MFYSRSTNGFYSREIHGDNVPSDAVEIADKTYDDLMAAQAAGKVIAAGENGPIAIDRIPDVAALKIRRAQALLDTTDAVALRCFKAGVPWPQEWQTTVVALRAFLAAKDASADLPSLPMKDGRVDYPAGS